jgi:hypothetical protein
MLKQISFSIFKQSQKFFSKSSKNEPVLKNISPTMAGSFGEKLDKDVGGKSLNALDGIKASGE